MNILKNMVGITLFCCGAVLGGIIPVTIAIVGVVILISKDA